ncbi:GNAT family N-acetyltransferase [Paralcaligenes ureilyticus]|uniref:Acetyltransferase (GNAT) family protein n=1 Tax=Paralcaligenes ureilyticus TaxID=627131 RepID=A0A4R3M7K7_9BURK|nr:GNAT family N-acetyltransferase [Paralcaligenes ureilyticus]TCT09062.1 acetyltransferase (GNAT) family protein [Paralcaligenes ureilyticus]
MTAALQFISNLATADQIADHLKRCDARFIPSLSIRVNIDDYAKKIVSKATRFEAYSGGSLVGVVAVYANQAGGVAYITNVSVLQAWSGIGVATRLMDLCIAHAKAAHIQRICLEVGAGNASALRFYERIGFTRDQLKDGSVFMHFCL